MESTIFLRALRLGILFSVGSSFTGTVATLVVKKTDIPIGQIIFSSHLLLTILAFILCFIHKQSLKSFSKHSVFSVWSKTMLTIPKMYFSNKTSKLLPSFDDTLFGFTGIILTLIFSRFLFKESFIKRKLAATIVLFIGAFLFSDRFDFTHKNFSEGTVDALYSALYDAVKYIEFKELTEMHYTVIMLVHGITGVILSAPSYIVEYWTLNHPKELILSSVFIPLEEIFFIIALTIEQTGLVSIIHALNVIFVYVWELYLSKETYSHLKTIGSVLVVLSVIFCSYLPKDKNNDTKTEEINADEQYESLPLETINSNSEEA